MVRQAEALLEAPRDDVVPAVVDVPSDGVEDAELVAAEDACVEVDPAEPLVTPAERTPEVPAPLFTPETDELPGPEDEKTVPDDEEGPRPESLELPPPVDDDQEWPASTERSVLGVQLTTTAAETTISG